tara:strand:- start:364 stop:1797 length:1434 start_codon:yes stop_codon:yes gene_type:complete
MKICPVILSGGSGTRLWPFSRTSFPKQFLDNLFSKSLFCEALERVSGSELKLLPPIIVCNQEHQFLALKDIKKSGTNFTKVLLESEGRNTAPACTLAALYLQESFEEEILMLVLPADQKIESNNALFKCVNSLQPLAENGSLCTFGIKPKNPHTGYGYLQVSASKKDKEVYKIKRFHEKPSRNDAKTFMSSGDFFWNSGCFLFSNYSYLESLKKTSPLILSSCNDVFDTKLEQDKFIFFDENEFAKIPSDSIDYSLMEKCSSFGIPIHMAELTSEWSDLGSWSSIHEISQKDENGNSIEGDVVSLDTLNSLLVSEDSLLATMGLKDMIVINTQDAILVASKDSEDKIRNLIEILKQKKREELNSHQTVYRPWGTFTVIQETKNHKIKKIIVNPNSSLSLQRHKYRSEHWIVLSGKANVVKGEEVFELLPDQSIFIPANTVHSLINKQDENLSIIEVQTGSYLGEDDIERLKDDYGRV